MTADAATWKAYQRLVNAATIDAIHADAGWDVEGELLDEAREAHIAWVDALADEDLLAVARAVEVLT